MRARAQLLEKTLKCSPLPQLRGSLLVSRISFPNLYLKHRETTLTMASRAMTAAFAAILACAIAPMAAAQGQPGQSKSKSAAECKMGPPSLNTSAADVPRLPSAAYSSLAPPELVVALAYNISGTVSTPAPCTNSWSNSTCLPQVSLPLEWFSSRAFGPLAVFDRHP